MLIRCNRCEETIGTREKVIGALARKAGENCVDFADRSGIEDLNFQSHAGGDFSNILCRRVETTRIAGIDENGNTSGLRDQVMQEPQPLGGDLGDEKVDPG